MPDLAGEVPSWREPGRLGVASDEVLRPWDFEWGEATHQSQVLEFAAHARVLAEAVRSGLCGAMDALADQVQGLTEERDQLLAQRAELQRSRDAIAADRDRHLADSQQLQQIVDEPWREQWVVFYGPDPDNFAALIEYHDQAEAEEMLRCGSGVAHRTLYAGPWVVTVPRLITQTITERQDHSDDCEDVREVHRKQ